MPENDSTPGTWEQTVHLMTGWKVPARQSVTSDLKGSANSNGGNADAAVDTPWLSVTISNAGKTDATALAQRLTAQGGTWVLFYAGTGDAGPMKNAKALNLYIAKINYAWQSGGGLTGTNLHKYANGVGPVLGQLQASPWRTGGFSFDGLTVADTDSVDLGTFSHRARSLDRANLFFEEHETLLDGWVNAMGRDNAAWQGNAAGVFVNLLDTLRKQYKHYHEQLAPRGFSTQSASKVDGYVSKTFQGNGLILAEQALSKAVQTLKDAWDKWHGDQFGNVTGKAPDGSANTPAGHWNPEDVMNGVLNELKTWLNANNAGKVITNYNIYGGTNGGTEYWYDLQAGFKENVPAYGSLTDPANWAKIAQEGVARWTAGITAHLDPAAETARTTLSATWSQLMNTDWDPAYGFEEAPPATLGTTGNPGGNNHGTTNFGPDDIANLFNQQNTSVNDALNNIASSTNNALNDVGTSTNDALNNLFGGGGGAGGSGLDGIGDIGGPSVAGLGTDGPTVGTTGGDSVLGTSPTYASLLNNALNGIGSPGTNGTRLNADRSITVTNADGSTTTTRPDGTEVTQYPDGSTLTVDPDGRSTLVNGDGSTSVQNADGSVSTTYRDGSTTTLDPDGTYTVRSADGDLNHLDLKPGQTVTNPDGSRTTLNADGSITTTYPDGLVTTLGPDGRYTVDTPPAEGVRTSSSPPPNQPVTSTTGGTGLNSLLDHALNGPVSGTVPQTGPAHDGDFLYDDVPYTHSLSGALGGQLPGSAPTGTLGLNPGAMAAASRMGGLGGEMSAAERVRSGYADSDAANGTGRGTGVRAASTAEQAAARTATSSGMPFIPPGAGAGPGAQSTQSAERTRTTWLSEDEEVWGTDEAAAPAVLGRDD
ncbi:AAWKG family protein [Streptomyces heilongjiangensis]|uniref:AAWKG family protein n=1 Tax=Streptomyces heilongjiangensis TaxID=945052 RepID=A0ABW1BAP7_9ACTN|nr:AAWKG family protein [Streptomyces heilongjiangensis]MDC2950522.1 AAWKG family protein [Streptomyces heilongjiangensis]